MKLWTTMLAVLCLALGALAGCGGDDEESPGEPAATETGEVEVTEENEIEGAIAVWYGDDLNASCGILSSEALKEIGGIQKCLGNAAKPTGTKVKVSEIKIEGDTATAQAVASGTIVGFELVLEDGQWLVRSPTPLIF